MLYWDYRTAKNDWIFESRVFWRFMQIFPFGYTAFFLVWFKAPY